MSPTRGRLVSLAAALALGCSPQAPPPLPGMELLARAEAHLRQHEAAFAQDLSHYGALFPVRPEQLDAFMARIRCYGEGADLVLGTSYALESHGGGLLRLLLDHWRPDARPARLDDRYPFAADGTRLELRQLYDAYRQQVFLPVPGTPAEATGGALPETHELPRMLLRFRPPGGSGSRTVELDAYKLLSLLVELEPDPERTWRNRFGQTLSAALLLRHVRGHYLASRPTRAEPPDHSDLHLVGLLVAWEAATGARDLAAVQRHFLAQELAQRELDPADATLLLGHQAESLGLLLGAPELAWSDEQKRHVRRWLEELEARWPRELAGQDLEPLAHLVVGLRLVRDHRAALE
jgi:hypothetical protein